MVLLTLMAVANAPDVVSNVTGAPNRMDIKKSFLSPLKALKCFLWNETGQVSSTITLREVPDSNLSRHTIISG
jgi:hypothetical protein